MNRLRSVLPLLLLAALLAAGCSSKKAGKGNDVYRAENGAYSIAIPKGWSPVLKDRVNMKVLYLKSDTTAEEGSTPEIVVISDDHRLPLDFENVARDAIFKMEIIRQSSRSFALLDSSRIKVDGREGVIYTYERQPKYARTDLPARHVVMVFLQTTQGMVDIKYIAPVPVSQETRELFNRNLESVKLRDIVPEMTDEELQQLREEHRKMMQIQPSKPDPNGPSSSPIQEQLKRKAREKAQ